MTVSQGIDRFANSAQTTLNMVSGLAIGATTMTVTSALAFPNPGPYRVLIDNEIIDVTGGYGTTTWNILKGREGTSDSSHTNGATVTQMVSAFELNSFRQEFNVFAYGAKGDGSTDDSTPFQQAINDAHAQTVGGVVFLPTFSYNIASALTTYSNVVFVTYGATITGVGASSVTPVIKWSLTGGLTLPGSISGTNGLTVSGGLTISSGGLTITGGGSITGNLTITPSQTSGQTGLTISPANVSSVTAETIGTQWSAQTLTITGGFTTERFRWMRQPTITAGSALTVTNAATFAIEGAPVAGGSAVITNPWSMWIQGGTSRFDGTVDVNAQGIVRGTGMASGGIALNVLPPAVGSVTAETQSTLISANTLTITSGFTTERFNLFAQPTISAGSALTVTNAATLAIAGAPLAAGSAVITNAYALWIQAGITEIDGPIIHAVQSTDTIPVLGSGTGTGTGARIFITATDPASGGGSPANGDCWIAG